MSRSGDLVALLFLHQLCFSPEWAPVPAPRLMPHETAA